jgi:hypothetical protein
MRIDCVLGATTQASEVVRAALGNGAVIAEAFAEGSDGNIEVTVDLSRLDSPLAPGAGPVEAYDLHEALAELTKNPKKPGRVSRVAVIFADSYGPESEALGVMFDRGFTTFDDPNDTALYTGVPREGCAVFLGAIGMFRNHDPQAVAEEICFNTMHELGHVFNLPHRNQPRSYMSRSDPGRSGARGFVDDHKSLLARCSESPNICPGGSKYGDVGTLSKWIDGDTFNTSPFEDGLRLEVSIEPREFWNFEPVELDVRISVARARRSIRIPNAVDPGYSQFRIWIEEPSGERRLYRCPRHYCHTKRRRTIGPGRSFERDISIFAEEGGFTFRKVGVHKVWAEFDVGRRGVLASEPFAVNVLPYPHEDAAGTALRNALVDRGLAQLAFHRRARLPRDLVEHVDALRARLGPLPAVTSLEYALGRALLKGGGKESRAQEAVEQGARLLDSALNGGLPGRHRRTLAETHRERAHG